MADTKIIEITDTTYVGIKGEEARIVQEAFGTDTIYLSKESLLKMAHEIINTLEGNE